jgi:hypothetical protein
LHRPQCKATKIIKNQANLIPEKEFNKAPVTNPKESEINDLPEKEFKIII